MREVHWATKYNVMFIDNPVGTGFSYTLNSKGFVTNQKEVGADLLSLLYQFYQSAHTNRHEMAFDTIARGSCTRGRRT
jgi:carboxypeptidase C (cathepsin A)